jgi:hypothetical protein
MSSAVCDTEVIVVRTAVAELSVTCGGIEMVAPGQAKPAGEVGDPELMNGSLLGKRYSDAAGQVELLCVHSGTGTVSINGSPTVVMVPKSLPASD